MHIFEYDTIKNSLKEYNIVVGEVYKTISSVIYTNFNSSLNKTNETFKWNDGIILRSEDIFTLLDVKIIGVGDIFKNFAHFIEFEILYKSQKLYFSIYGSDLKSKHEMCKLIKNYKLNSYFIKLRVC